MPSNLKTIVKLYVLINVVRSSYSNIISAKNLEENNSIDEDPGNSNDSEKIFLNKQNHFIIYNRNHSNVRLCNGKRDEWNSLFIKGLPCVFITHGWINNAYASSVQVIVEAYLKMKEMNIVSIDWSSGSRTEYAMAASSSVPKTGEDVGRTVSALIERGLCEHDSIHLIGHSLGAHIMGIAGYTVRNITERPVARITGLDAAGPLFGANGLSHKLDSGDADFVDAIHSDTRFGTTVSVGHADFFPNGQAGQPACPNTISMQIFCNHKQAFYYYAMSVYNETAYPSTKCESYSKYLAGDCSGNDIQYMGYSVSPSTRGNFYLTINSPTNL